MSYPQGEMPTMKAAVLEAYHQPLAIRDAEITQPGPGEVTVAVKAVGLCLTDVHSPQIQPITRP